MTRPETDHDAERRERLAPVIARLVRENGEDASSLTVIARLRAALLGDVGACLTCGAATRATRCGRCRRDGREDRAATESELAMVVRISGGVR